jgi:hypothetical protein
VDYGAKTIDAEFWAHKELVTQKVSADGNSAADSDFGEFSPLYRYARDWVWRSYETCV